jgi:hypothetical protein
VRAAPLAAHLVDPPVVQLPEEPAEEPVWSGSIGGAIVGAIFLGIPGAVLGYSFGSGGGLSRSLAHREIQAQIPPGAPLDLVIDAPVPLAPLRCAPGAR